MALSKIGSKKWGVLITILHVARDQLPLSQEILEVVLGVDLYLVEVLEAEERGALVF